MITAPFSARLPAFLFAVATSLAFAPPGSCGDDPLKDPEVTRTLEMLNAARKQAGVPEVKLSASLAQGCHLHAKYLVLNRGNPLVEGLKAHEEHESLKGYTKEGAKAAKASVIHFIPPSKAVADWLASFYHRVPLLQPQLAEVGIGYYTDKKALVSLVDCISGMNFRAPGKPAVYFPEDKQTGVGRTLGPEIPSPLPPGHKGEAGFPITITFAMQMKITKVTFSLKDARGKDVPVYVSTPEKPASSWIQWNTVCAIPRQPLGRGEDYTAHLQYTVDGKDHSRMWTFTTAK